MSGGAGAATQPPGSYQGARLVVRGQVSELEQSLAVGLDELGGLLLAERLTPASGLAGAEELGLAVGPRLDEAILVLLGLIPRSVDNDS